MLGSAISQVRVAKRDSFPFSPIRGVDMLKPGVEGEKDFKACYNKALHLISLRSHFTRELEAKLLQREFSSEDVARTLEQLADKGFLDEQDTARQFVAARRRRLGEVGIRLIQELRKRGADGDLAAQVVGELDQEGDLERARSAVERLRARGSDDDRIARRLSRKGFNKGDILRALNT